MVKKAQQKARTRALKKKRLDLYEEKEEDYDEEDEPLEDDEGEEEQYDDEDDYLDDDPSIQPLKKNKVAPIHDSGRPTIPLSTHLTPESGQTRNLRLKSGESDVWGDLSPSRPGIGDPRSEIGGNRYERLPNPPLRDQTIAAELSSVNDPRRKVQTQQPVQMGKGPQKLDSGVILKGKGDQAQPIPNSSNNIRSKDNGKKNDLPDRYGDDQNISEDYTNMGQNGRPISSINDPSTQNGSKPQNRPGISDPRNLVANPTQNVKQPQYGGEKNIPEDYDNMGQNGRPISSINDPSTQNGSKPQNRPGISDPRNLVANPSQNVKQPQYGGEKNIPEDYDNMGQNGRPISSINDPSTQNGSKPQNRPGISDPRNLVANPTQNVKQPQYGGEKNIPEDYDNMGQDGRPISSINDPSTQNGSKPQNRPGISDPRNLVANPSQNVKQPQYGGEKNIPEDYDNMGQNGRPISSINDPSTQNGSKAKKQIPSIDSGIAKQNPQQIHQIQNTGKALPNSADRNEGIIRLTQDSDSDDQSKEKKLPGVSPSKPNLKKNENQDPLKEDQKLKDKSNRGKKQEGRRRSSQESNDPSSREGSRDIGRPKQEKGDTAKGNGGQKPIAGQGTKLEDNSRMNDDESDDVAQEDQNPKASKTQGSKTQGGPNSKIPNKSPEESAPLDKYALPPDFVNLDPPRRNDGEIEEPLGIKEVPSTTNFARPGMTPMQQPKISGTNGNPTLPGISAPITELNNELRPADRIPVPSNSTKSPQSTNNLDPKGEKPVSTELTQKMANKNKPSQVDKGKNSKPVENKKDSSDEGEDDGNKFSEPPKQNQKQLPKPALQQPTLQNPNGISDDHKPKNINERPANKQLNVPLGNNGQFDKPSDGTLHDPREVPQEASNYKGFDSKPDRDSDGEVVNEARALKPSPSKADSKAGNKTAQRPTEQPGKTQEKQPTGQQGTKQPEYKKDGKSSPDKLPAGRDENQGKPEKKQREAEGVRMEAKGKEDGPGGRPGNKEDGKVDNKPVKKPSPTVNPEPNSQTRASPTPGPTSKPQDSSSDEEADRKADRERYRRKNRPDILNSKIVNLPKANNDKEHKMIKHIEDHHDFEEQYLKIKRTAMKKL
jgi:hypothetical protein